MKIITKRLILRDATEKDARDIVEYAHDTEIWYFVTTIPYPYSLKDARWFIKKCKKDSKKKQRDNYQFFIELKTEKKIIGGIGIHHLDKTHKKAEVGYCLNKKYRKQRIMSEAEKAVLNFAFNKLKLNKIMGRCMTENKGSVALFKKFGFRKVGIMKEDLIRTNKKLKIYNKKVDGYLWELLKKDYKFS